MSKDHLMRVTARPLVYIAFVLAALVGRITTAHAKDNGNAPAWHLGSFKKNARLTYCIQFAKDALTRHGCKILHQDSYTVLGGDDHIIVEVACAPRGDATTWVVVTAFSSDSDAAAAARSKVREYIVKVVRIDN